MSDGHLIEMANQIGRFYEAFPDRAEGLKSAAMHLRRFWDPRMRIAFGNMLNGDGAEALSPFMREAVAAHRAELIPAAATSPVQPGSPPPSRS